MDRTSLALRQWSVQALMIALSPMAIGFAQEGTGVWQLEQRGSFSARGGRIIDVSANAEGSLLVSLGAQQDLIVWDLRSLKIARRIEALAERTDAFALHPTEPILAAGLTLETGRRWVLTLIDLQTGEQRTILRNRVVALAWSLDGRRLAAVSNRDYKQFLDLFDSPRGAITGRRSVLLPGDPLVAVVCFDPDGKTVRATGAADPHGWPDSHVAVDVAGEVVSTCSGAVLGASGGHQRHMLMVRDGRQLWLGEKHIGVLDRMTVMLGFSPHTTGVYGVGGSEKGVFQTLAQGDYTGPGLVSGAQGLGFVDPLPGDRLIANEQGQLHVLHGERHDVLGGHLGEVFDLCFSPDGMFVACSGLGAVVVHDLGGHEVGLFMGAHGIDAAAAGAEFVLLDRRGTVRWNARTQRQQTILDGWPGDVWPVLPQQHATWLPAARGILALECVTTGLVLLDPATRAATALLPRQGGVTLLDLTTSPKGDRVLAMAGLGPQYLPDYKGLFLAWSGTGEEMSRKGFRADLAAYSPDGRGLLIGGVGERIHLMRTDPFDEQAHFDCGGEVHWVGFLDAETAVVIADGALTILTVPGLKPAGRIPIPGTSALETKDMRVALSPSSRHVAIGIAGQVTLYRLVRR